VKGKENTHNTPNPPQGGKRDDARANECPLNDKPMTCIRQSHVTQGGRCQTIKTSERPIARKIAPFCHSSTSAERKAKPKTAVEAISVPAIAFLEGVTIDDTCNTLKGDLKAVYATPKSTP
jgi:hypothetical protein